MTPVDFKLRRLGALKAENRLFLVPHHEKRPRRRAGGSRLSGEKLLAQLADDTPLLGAGVLAFVDENVIESAVEFVHHPGRGIAALKQAQCFDDQVVVIQNTTPAFQDAIFCVGGSARWSARRTTSAAARAPRQRCSAARNLAGHIEQLRVKRAVGVGKRLADKRFSRLAGCGEKNRAECVEGFGCYGRCQSLPELSIPGRSAGEPAGEIGNILLCLLAFGAELRGDVFGSARREGCHARAQRLPRCDPHRRRTAR